MVLFESDFAEQGAIADTSTKNLSFLKMALVLNQMGIHNNLFMLSLHDKDLKGIDPHNLHDDSLELKQRIAYEASINYWYFAREVSRISASGSGGIPYILSRANMAQAWAFFNCVNTMLVIPRQNGKTIGTMNLANHFVHVSAYNCDWAMFCKGNKLQYQNVDRLKKLRDALPPWMLHKTSDDTNNKEGLYYSKLKNGFLTFVAQSDKRAAGDQARGQSTAVQNWDETAYYDNIDLSYDSATAGMDDAGEKAKAAGLPSAIIQTTTAGDIDDPRGRWCYHTACDALRFTEKLYDLRDKQELMDVLRSNSKNNYLYMEFSYKQLGRTDEWFEQVTRNKSPKVIAKDYLNKWLHGSSGSILPADLINKIQGSRKDPVATTNYETLLIKWYDDPNVLKANEHLRNRPYVIGLDTSDNVGRDFTTMCMIDPYDMHVVATFKCNTTNLAFVARAMMRILMDFPRAIFIPERNKIGVVFIDYIFAEMRRDVFDPLARIFNRYYQEYTADTNVRNLNFDDGEVRRNFGFTTTKSATSREFLYSTVLMTAMKLVGDRLNDAALIDEICGISVKNGRVDHSEKGHDDLLIAFLLAAFFILFGANHHLYGISPDEFLCAVNESTGDNVDPELKMQQTKLRGLLDDYRAKLKHTSNPIIRQALEREIQKLVLVVGDAPMDESQVVSLEQAKHNATKEIQKASGMSGLNMLSFM